jgi:hypothetical protein
MIIEDIKNLLDLFADKVPDKESNRLVRKFVDDKNRWVKAHGLFTTIRERNLSAIKGEDRARKCQYRFEEACAKTLYNLTYSSAPFDADSPYWIIKNALILANELDISDDKVVSVVAPKTDDNS